MKNGLFVACLVVAGLGIVAALLDALYLSTFFLIVLVVLVGIHYVMKWRLRCQARATQR